MVHLIGHIRTASYYILDDHFFHSFILYPGCHVYYAQLTAHLTLSLPFFPLMAETKRLLEAASTLSDLLRSRGIPHAFHGSVLTATLANVSHSDEILCIVENGHSQHHPFRRVRDAISSNEDFKVTHSPWTDRLHVVYRRFIPAIEIEILPSGEAGPRRLDANTVMRVQGVPFLTISEFVRAKLNSWMIRRLDRDAQDINYVLSRYWNRVDINRIPEHDMTQFVASHSSAASSWAAIKKKYGM